MRKLHRIRWYTPTPREKTAAPAGFEAIAIRTFRDAVRDVLERTGIPIVEGVHNAREFAIELLRLAAEAEHALLVQYLYSAASVRGVGPNGIDYREMLSDIAVEEMGHLCSVQNLLLLLGRREALHMQRDVVRNESDKNPLPFVVEPVSRAALAKYVAVEMPAEVPPELQAKVDELVALAKADSGVEPHRVGAIYALLLLMFSPPDPEEDPEILAKLPFNPYLKESDLLGLADMPRYEAQELEWGVNEAGIILGTARTIAEARDLLEKIASQGEGLPSGGDPSHFAEFLTLVDAFDNGDIPVIPLAKGPILGTHGSEQGTPITNEYTKFWGEVFNLQYQTLVLTIHHALATPRSTDGTPGRREKLASLAILLMRRVIGAVSRILASLPLKNDGSADLAGPPYDLDPTILDSLDETVLIATHLRLLDRLAELYTTIEASAEATPQHKTAVLNLRNRDKERRQAITPPPQESSMRYRIFPSIGIARLGADPDYFLGPEIPGAGPIELDGTPVTRFKNGDLKRVRKQGARFHLFESSDGTNWTPAVLPAGATVKWTVALKNKKAAVDRPPNPPIAPTKPVVQAANEPAVIDGGTKEVSGTNAVSTPLEGTYKSQQANGTPYQIDVELGLLRTNSAGRLIVLGGNGVSTAPPGTSLGPSYYRNPKWHDDVSDGPVTATITFPGPGARIIDAEEGAWVIVGPPDYAPEIDCIVTLHDVLRDVGAIAAPAVPSFERDIKPMLTRIRRLRWVHSDATWSSADLDDPNLGIPGSAHQALRTRVRDNIILETENVFEGHTSAAGPPFRLRAFQKTMLDTWVAGTFDTTALPTGGAPTAEGLTRAALDGTAGQGFCPGIEGGILLLDKTLYTTPFDFRISHTAIKAGDLTALMAQPWQADFLKCETEWWPIQRPDLAPQADGSMEPWIRGVHNHSELVQWSPRLGFVVQQGTSEVFVETERDPTLPIL